jgi:hypothetical protein
MIILAGAVAQFGLYFAVDGCAAQAARAGNAEEAKTAARNCSRKLNHAPYSGSIFSDAIIDLNAL